MIKINLQPKISMEVKEGFKLPLWLPILLTVILTVSTAMAFWFMQQRRLTAEAQIKQLDYKLRDFQKIIDSYEQAKAEKDYLQQKRDFVNGISQNQKQWVDFFDELRAKMPKDVWIEKFDGMRAGTYSLDGRTFSYSSVGFFMLQFNSIPYISSVTLDQASSKQGTGAAGSTSVSKSFKITGEMKLEAQQETKEKTVTANTTSASAPPASIPAQ
jgi:Tfp pilus assembly protein PilN